jgi:hypothetical protein
MKLQDVKPKIHHREKNFLVPSLVFGFGVLTSVSDNGPVELTGGRGQGVSIYTRDPERNFLEFIIYGDS